MAEMSASQMSNIVISQSSGTIFYVRFKMEEGIAVLGVAASRNFHQPLNQGCASRITSWE